jgi:phosphate transport system substrate-binding protein
MLVKWPVGLAAPGNEGVADAVKQQVGAIGYVELSYAITKSISYALLQNRSGDWIDATSESIGAAAAKLAADMPSDLQQSITDAPGATAYPISSYSYLLFFREQKDATVAKSFADFTDWILSDGQSYTASLHYAPVPKTVADRAQLQLKRIDVSAGRVNAASCKSELRTGEARSHASRKTGS